MNKYKIYYTENNKDVFLCDFEANSEEEAANKVDEYKNNPEFVKEHGSEIFWDNDSTINECDENGKVIKSWNSVESMFSDLKEDDKNMLLGEKIWNWIYRKWYKLDLWNKIKYGFERMFKGYDRRVEWNINLSIANLLRYAVPRYIKNLHSCPVYYYKLARKMTRSMSKEEVEKSFEKEYNPTNDEVSIGITLYKSDLERMINDINIISYYDSCGIQDEKDKNYVDPIKYPIPRLRNSKLIDYKKLSELRETKMDYLFSFLRKNIDDMWD